MSRQLAKRDLIPQPVSSRIVTAAAVCLALLFGSGPFLPSADNHHPTAFLRILADKRMEKPVRAIIQEYCRLMEARITPTFLSFPIASRAE